jgi:nucleoside 2-deoxyribosyltransferase
MLSLYLCGPINGCTDEECKNWREFVKANWKGTTIDPMRRDYRGKELESYREIVELDKVDVAKADVMIVNYDKPSVGTSMEVIFAWMIGKPVVVVAANPDVVISPWLRYHAHFIEYSFSDALETIQRVFG